MFGGPWEGTTGLAAIAGLALELWVRLEVKEPPLEFTGLGIGCYKKDFFFNNNIFKKKGIWTFLPTSLTLSK